MISENKVKSQGGGVMRAEAVIRSNTVSCFFYKSCTKDANVLARNKFIDQIYISGTRGTHFSGSYQTYSLF